MKNIALTRFRSAHQHESNTSPRNTNILNLDEQNPQKQYFPFNVPIRSPPRTETIIEKSNIFKNQKSFSLNNTFYTYLQEHHDVLNIKLLRQKNKIGTKKQSTNFPPSQKIKSYQNRHNQYTTTNYKIQPKITLQKQLTPYPTRQPDTLPPSYPNIKKKNCFHGSSDPRPTDELNNAKCMYTSRKLKL